MKGEDAYLNKQGSTSTKMDSHTHVTLSHVQAKNHGGIPHTQQNCGKDMEWRTKEDYTSAVNDAILANKGSSDNLKKVSKDHDNLLGTRLIRLRNIQNHHFAPWHTVNGISIKLLKMEKYVLRQLDSEKCYNNKEIWK